MKHKTAAAGTQVWIEGHAVDVLTGSSVAAALALRPPGASRRSVSGQWRSPFCGMGVCHECRVLIDGLERLACQTVCQDGMQITTTGTALPRDPPTAREAGAA